MRTLEFVTSQSRVSVNPGARNAVTDWSLVNETLVARNSVIYWNREIVSLAVMSSGICWSHETESPVDVNFVTCGCRVTVNLVASCCSVVRGHVALGS